MANGATNAIEHASSPYRIVVVGGGFAGILAAQKIARSMPRAAAVTLVCESSTFVERVRLHQVATRQSVARPSIAPMVNASGVAFQHGRARVFDLDRRRVVVVTHEGREESLDYDALVYAGGSSVDLETVPGSAEHCASLATEVSALSLGKRLLSFETDARVVVCGGGLTGIELATEIAETHPTLAVSLVTRGTLGEAFSPRGQAHTRAAFERLRIHVEENAEVEEVRKGELVLRGGSRMPFDLCAWAASFRSLPLAREAGLDVNARGQVLVDAYLRSVSHPDVFAVGDCAATPASIGVRIRMGCATAMPMAAFAAHNVRRSLQRRPMTEFRYAYLAQFVSFGRRDALAQFVRSDDSPRSIVLTGRVAGWMKDATFRFNLRALRTGFYPWWLLGAFGSIVRRTRRVELL